MGNIDSLKQYIQHKQIETKQLLCKLRSLERKLYHLREKIELEINQYNFNYQQPVSLDSQPPNCFNNRIYVIQELRLENKNMEKEYRECKKMLNELSDELNISISCYKEIMIEKRAINLAQTPIFLQHVLSNNNSDNHQKLGPAIQLISPSLPHSNSTLLNSLTKNSTSSNDTIDLDQLAQQSILNNEIPKRYEIWFKNTKWKLNEPDGKTGQAQFLMKNFLYTKVTNQQELDCVEHNLEIESCKLQDLTTGKANGGMGDPNTSNRCNLFQDVLSSLFENSNEASATAAAVATASSSSHQTSILDESLKEKQLILNRTASSKSKIGSSSSSSRSLSCSSSSSADLSSSHKLLNESLTSSVSISSNQNNNDTAPILVNNNNRNMTMVRIYCKEKPPVGIPVFEHLELNVSPLSIKLTNRFFKMMLKFFFENQSNETRLNNNVTNSSGTNNGNSSNINNNTNTASSSKNFHRHSYNLIQASSSSTNANTDDAFASLKGLK